MNDKITCPNCGHHFDVEEALSGQLEQKYQKQYQEKVEQQAEQFRAKQQKLDAERNAFEEAKRKENELFQERLVKKVEEEKLKLQKEAQEQAELEIKSLKEDNQKSKEELRKMKEKEIQLLKRENQLKDAQEELEIKMQKQILEQQKAIEEQGRIKEREANELREKEYQKQLEDQKKLIEEMKRKAEQGSMQLQGEVQELAIEEYLSQEFPFDSIEEIKKGAQGGDCIQTVNTREILNCGSIYYESKRTQNYNEAWIEKLKKDMQAKSVGIGVLVTQAMPSDMNRMGLRDGIWVCNFTEFKGLSHVLRESLIMLRKNSIVQENKGDKMSLLYDFLTSQEFKMQMETIVDGFTKMREQLESEKRAFFKQWKQREKQIDRVIQSTVEMYGSIKGIAGNSVPQIGSLELDSTDDEFQIDE